MFGLALGVIGLVLEHFGIEGFCNRTGYVHLRFFDKMFYAMHSETEVLKSVFVINALLGFGVCLIAVSSFQALKRDIQHRREHGDV